MLGQPNGAGYWEEHPEQLDRALIDIDLAASAKGLAGFTEAAWHILEPTTDLQWGWALDAICEHLQAVHSGEISQLLINCPPGCTKSLLTGVLFPAWEWGPQGRADLRYLATAHKQDLAVRDNMKCRRLIQSRWYQERWPGVVLTGDQNAKTKFENEATGFREAMAFTSMTGSRGDRVLLDDPLSVDGAGSEAERLAAELTFSEALPTRLNNEKSAMIVIMQRLHERDTSGIILSKELDYVHLRLPMNFESDRRCSTSIGFVDPRKEDGELLFPERFPAEQVTDLRKQLGEYAFAGQFQQRPAPREGGMFKRHWFEVVGAVPAGARRVRGWDLAGTEASAAVAATAYTAGVKMCRVGDVFYIEDMTRIQGSAHEVETLLTSTASQDGLDCEISIPQDPGSAGKSYVRYLIGKLAGYNARYSPESGSKEMRAQPLSAQAEAGNVKLVRGDWNEAFIEEACLFPNGTHLDQIDAASRAFDTLAGSFVQNLIVPAFDPM